MLRNVNELSGYTLQAVDGEIGTVEQFYFDDQAWTVRYLVVQTGSWLSGRKVIISPVAVKQPDWEAARFPVKLSKDQVKHSPSIASDQPVSRQYQTRLHEYYNWPMYWSYPGDFSPMYARVPAPHMKEEEEEKTAEDEGYDPHLRSTKEVTGYQIQAKDGDIGHVEDFILDDQTWTIRYLVVDTGNWLSGRKVLIAPSWIEAVKWPGHTVRVKFSQEAVKNSPSFIPARPLERAYEEDLYNHYDMPKYWHGKGDLLLKTHLGNELNGKLIISLANGEIIAKLEDLLIDPDKLRVGALVTNKGGILKRKTEAIPGEAVQLWGQDVILIVGSNMITDLDELIADKGGLSLADQLKGHQVVNIDGTRLGQLSDVVIDDQGQVVAYELGQVFAKEQLAGLRQITVEATHSLGQDVLIVDLSKIQ